MSSPCAEQAIGNIELFLRAHSSLLNILKGSSVGLVDASDPTRVIISGVDSSAGERMRAAGELSTMGACQCKEPS